MQVFNQTVEYQVGQKIYKGHTLNGVKHGNFTKTITYHNEVIDSIINYKYINGVKQRFWIKVGDSDNIIETRFYVNGVRSVDGVIEMREPKYYSEDCVTEHIYHTDKQGNCTKGYIMYQGEVVATSSYTLVNGVKHGLYIKTSKLWDLTIACNYVDGKREGKYVNMRNTSGLPRETREYVNNKIHGNRIIYHINGEVNLIKQYSNNVPHGFTSCYDINGKYMNSNKYIDGQYCYDDEAKACQ